MRLFLCFFADALADKTYIRYLCIHMNAKHLILPFAALICTLLCSSCMRKEFDIDIELSSKTAETYQIVYYTHDKHKGWMTQTAITLSQGNGKLKCITSSPTMVWVYPMGSSRPSLAFYARRGDNIKISGDNGDPATWQVTGNDLDEQWSRWRSDNADALRSRQPKLINEVVSKYVKAHPDSQLSAVLMLTTFVRRDYEDLYTSLWNSLSEKARDAEIVKAAGRADQLTTALAATPEKIASLSLHCMGETIVTLRPDKHDAVLLYFWQGQERERKGHIDSLQALARTSAGSGLLITDIALTHDSLSWLNAARADSVTKSDAWLRAWAPGGRQHSSIMALQIPTSPWFVIIDKGGRQLYRGTEASEALRRVRTMIHNSKTSPRDTTSS